jgi:hypothetical protein
VDVDGTQTFRDCPVFEISKPRRYPLRVGESEQHQVVIEKRKKAWRGGQRQRTFRVYVDGELIDPTLTGMGHVLTID